MALARAVNPILVRLAGAGVVPVWGLVRHRGRRSGRLYATPIAVVRTDDGFLIPLPFGERTDWCRNILSAGGGVLRWKGTDHEVTDPTVIAASAAERWFAPPLRAGLRAFGIKQVLRVRRRSAPPTR
jgi:deazaflavin-dependent oxidoreductase (nitroreductase family)